MDDSIRSTTNVLLRRQSSTKLTDRGVQHLDDYVDVERHVDGVDTDEDLRTYWKGSLSSGGVYVVVLIWGS